VIWCRTQEITEVAWNLFGVAPTMHGASGFGVAGSGRNSYQYFSCREEIETCAREHDPKLQNCLALFSQAHILQPLKYVT
jgi:hypothetical protein